MESFILTAYPIVSKITIITGIIALITCLLSAACVFLSVEADSLARETMSLISMIILDMVCNITSIIFKFGVISWVILFILKMIIL